MGIIHLTAKMLNSTNPYALQEELDRVRYFTSHLSQQSEMVMIGAGPGVFALAMLEDRRDPPRLHIIDHDTFQWASLYLEQAGCRTNQVSFVKGDSSTIGRGWTAPVDFLLVDGDHSYEGVKKDIEAWLPHVKPFSTVFFHDYLERSGGFNGSGAWEKGGCAKAVDEAIGRGWLVLKAFVGISAVCIRTEFSLD